MDLATVQAAYAARAEEYAALFDVVEREDAATALVERHLTGLTGRVLDLGCGPGQWTAHLHALGAEVVGVDAVAGFVEHARRAHPGPEFRLGSMTALDEPPGSAAGLLAWFSTIHLPRGGLAEALSEFRRLLADDGVLVLGFFDSEAGPGPFDHAVVRAHHWPVDTMASLVGEAGFTEVERLRWRSPDRPDRRYAALAARAH